MVLLLVFGLTIQAISLGAYAAEVVVPGRLPEPLSLQDVLRFFDADHPSLVSARTRVDLAVNRLERARSSYGWTAYADLQPRLASKAARPGHNFDDDSRYGIVVRKRLTDFGRRHHVCDHGDTRVGHDPGPCLQLRWVDCQCDVDHR